VVTFLQTGSMSTVRVVSVCSGSGTGLDGGSYGRAGSGLVNVTVVIDVRTSSVIGLDGRTDSSTGSSRVSSTVIIVVALSSVIRLDSRSNGSTSTGSVTSSVVIVMTLMSSVTQKGASTRRVSQSNVGTVSGSTGRKRVVRGDQRRGRSIDRGMSAGNFSQMSLRNGVSSMSTGRVQSAVYLGGKTGFVSVTLVIVMDLVGTVSVAESGTGRVSSMRSSQAGTSVMRTGKSGSVVRTSQPGVMRVVVSGVVSTVSTGQVGVVVPG
jgi:hypothetical protein